MALHALAIVATHNSERSTHLRGAIADYEQSIASQDDWDTRGNHWKRALRSLRHLAPDDASTREPRMIAASKRYGI